MKPRKPLNEPLLYLIAFCLALFVRLASLGNTMLTDYEASYALQALNISRGAHPLMGSQPGYVLLTSILFFLFGSGNQFLARLWPALFGSLVVIIPWIWRKRLGKLPAMIMAFALAFDPGLLALSRQVGSPILAVVGLWLGLSLSAAGSWALAGILLGLGLLGGPSFWLGAIGLGGGWLISRRWVDGARELETAQGAGSAEPSAPSHRTSLARLLYFAVGTLVLVGSLFFVYPQGLSGIFEGLHSFLAGWITPDGVPLATILLALAVYQPLALILGLWGAVRGWRHLDAVDRLLSMIAGVSLFAILVYPSRQVSDLAWVLLPLWGLAAREASRHLDISPKELIPAVGQALLVIVMAGFIWLNLESMVMNLASPSTTGLYAGFILGALLLTLLTSILIGWGWSSRVVRFGLVWGSSAALILYLVSVASGAGGYRDAFVSSLWLRGASEPHANLVLQTVNDFSRWNTGVVDDLGVQVVGVPSPSLQWLLRNYTGVQFTGHLSSATAPAIVITPKAQEPALSASYRGEALTWYEQPNWSQMLAGDFLHWIVYQTTPTTKTAIILWVRSDQFPGSNQGTSQNPNP